MGWINRELVFRKGRVTKKCVYALTTTKFAHIQ